MGVVGRGWRNSAVNHYVRGPDRYVDLMQARVPLRSFHAQVSERDRRSGREICDSSGDFLQGVTRELLVLGCNLGL